MYSYQTWKYYIQLHQILLQNIDCGDTGDDTDSEQDETHNRKVCLPDATIELSIFTAYIISSSKLEAHWNAYRGVYTQSHKKDYTVDYRLMHCYEIYMLPSRF